MPAGASAVRPAVAAIVMPGIFTVNPRAHSTQAILLVLVMVFAVSYVAKPLS